MIKNCLKCGKPFSVKPCEFNKYKHCSWKCRKSNIKITCLNCGKKFKIFPFEIKRKFCSVRCKQIASCGKPSWNKGKKCPQFSGENNPRWKGGRRYNYAGYIQIYKPEHPFSRYGYIFEHRLIVEQQIERYLLPNEHVHHLGKKDDNRPEMLMAFISNSAHKRFENGHILKPHEIIFNGH